MASTKTCTPLNTEELALARLVVRASCLTMWPKSLKGSINRPTEVWSQICTTVDQLEAVLETEESELESSYPILDKSKFSAFMSDAGESSWAHLTEYHKEAMKIHETVIAAIGEIRKYHQLIKSGKCRQGTYNRAMESVFSEGQWWEDVFANRLFLSADRLARKRVLMDFRDVVTDMVGETEIWSNFAEVTKPGYNPSPENETKLSPDSPWMKRGKATYTKLRQGLFLFLLLLSRFTLYYRTYFSLSGELNTSFDRFERVGAIREVQKMFDTGINLDVAQALEPLADLLEGALIGLEKAGKSFFDVIKEFNDVPGGDNKELEELEELENLAMGSEKKETEPENRQD